MVILKKRPYQSANEQNGNEGWSSKARSGGPSAYNAIDASRAEEYGGSPSIQIAGPSLGVKAIQGMSDYSVNTISEKSITNIADSSMMQFNHIEETQPTPIMTTEHPQEVGLSNVPQRDLLQSQPIDPHSTQGRKLAPGRGWESGLFPGSMLESGPRSGSRSEIWSRVKIENSSLVRSLISDQDQESGSGSGRKSSPESELRSNPDFSSKLDLTPIPTWGQGQVLAGSFVGAKLGLDQSYVNDQVLKRSRS
ncbi:hypothetical protein HAX54_045283 [Datura stramonium]|uniref:Uncharacterized protein n=1 Tax=Datura stramonium TaxID=4076 RepID=A0ABS8RPH9_DATST|nr:hypothetical protein [Datura stramonium]